MGKEFKPPWEKKKESAVPSMDDLDNMIRNRQRGRVIEGRVVPHDERMRELEQKKAEKGVLPPAEEAELVDLQVRLKGPLIERKRE